MKSGSLSSDMKTCPIISKKYGHFFSLLSILILLCCFSCTSKKPSVQRYADFPEKRVCKVALLPFINNSKFDQGHVLVQRVFGAQLTSSANIEVVSAGDVRKIFNELRIYPNQRPTIEQVRVLGSRLGVQALISGRIVIMEEKAGANQVNPALALSLEMHDAQNGETMFISYHRREGEDYRTLMHFGLVNTVTELSRIMADEIIEQWIKKGMKRCE